MRRRRESRRRWAARDGETNARVHVPGGERRARGRCDVIAQRWRDRDAEHARASAEAIEMCVEAKDHAVARAHRLEETIGEREAAVERRELWLVDGALDAI